MPCEKCSEFKLRVGCGVHPTQGGLKAIEQGKCVDCIKLCPQGEYSAQCMKPKSHTEPVAYSFKIRGDGRTLDGKADCTPCASSNCESNEFTDFAVRDD